MSDLYEDDIVLWSEHQAQLLRRRAAGELVNDADLDWPNIAEEIEAVGNEQRFAVESLLVQAIAHRLKAEAWPLCRDVENWLADSMRLRGDAASRFVPAMRHRIDPGSHLSPGASGHAPNHRWCGCPVAGAGWPVHARLASE